MQLLHIEGRDDIDDQMQPWHSHFYLYPMTTTYRKKFKI